MIDSATAVAAADLSFERGLYPEGVAPSTVDSLDASRILDVVLALALLFFAMPLMMLIAALVSIASPGPTLFVHRRLGRHGREFGCLKFRTMVVDAEDRLNALLESDPHARQEWAREHKLRYDPRTTPIGRVLRTLSLDELPQLFNVLRGEMSVVGPRPIVQAERMRYGRYFDHYCRVRPGLTGLWQVSGRNSLSYRRRVALDVRYARRRTLALDLWILLRTVSCVLRPNGH